ncbi:VOC family protein [Planomonospora sp. ID67723]|uniref:VOC family protein n=1 Tax=Planomonospora sp. ID67723 TaxID=2738134 RepID=UPI0018C43915|nr:VOC family protein [Planomonospora sp. ID67723]MBG0831343.1 VOC family protein [Planomonospora sp. ID67723]
MADEVTVPLLPCRSIDEIVEFYRALGFEPTYRQTRPNPYTALQREDLALHFFALDGFDPANSYGSCLVFVPDTGTLFESFAAGMRAAYGKLLVSGIPRMTRPRKRKNTGDLAGFTVVDPGGNWIRIFPSSGPVTRDEDRSGIAGAEQSRIAKAMENAIVLGESRGDHRQAARILDATLARVQDSASAAELVEALVYRAELAMRLDDGERVDALLDRVRDVPLGEADREALAETLAGVRDLEQARRADRRSSR